MKKYNFPILIILPLILFFSSCEDKEPTRDSIYSFVNETMHSLYLWYDEVPEVNYSHYNDPSDLLDDLMVPIDKWSFIDLTSNVEDLFEEGNYFGLGFYFRFDSDRENLYVAIIYENSTAYQQGIRKGDRIIAIDGVMVQQYTKYNALFDDSPGSYTFDIRDANQAYHKYTIEKETVAQNGVLFRDIYNASGKSTGYLVYDSFLGYSENELTESLQFFANSNIDELIIDLRYNGGGYVSLAEELANAIAPANTVGQEMYQVVHNDEVGPMLDTTVYFTESDLNLDLDQVIFITSEFSASASELLINCLEPYMNVILVGSRTYGKPVGMYGLEHGKWLMFPVTNKTLNADGYGEYFDGLPVDFETGEGLSHPWGDVTDPALDQALHYISFGNFNQSIPPPIFDKSGKRNLQLETKAKHPFLILDK